MADDPAVVVVGCELVASRSRDTEELWSLLRTSEPTFSEDSRRFDYRYFQPTIRAWRTAFRRVVSAASRTFTPHPGWPPSRTRV